MNGRSLTRSTTDKFLGGVCGGLARYLNLDSGLVRILTVVLAVFTQVGWVAYLVLWAVLPTDASSRTGIDEVKDVFGNRGGSAPPPGGCASSCPSSRRMRSYMVSRLALPVKVQPPPGPRTDSPMPASDRVRSTLAR